MSLFARHAFVCTQVRPEGHPKGCCAHRLPGDVIKTMWDMVLESGAEGVRVNTAGCLGLCDRGPVMVIYPDATWYSFKTMEDVQEITEKHLIGGRPVEHLKLA